MHNEPTVRLTAVRRLYEVSARMGAGRSLAETLQAVIDGVVDGLGFGIAVLNLRQPDGKFEVIAVSGSPEAREALLGTISAADIFDGEFAIADEWGGLRFVPHERLPEGDVVGWVPDVPVSDGAGRVAPAGRPVRAAATRPRTSWSGCSRSTSPRTSGGPARSTANCWRSSRPKPGWRSTAPG